MSNRRRLAVQLGTAAIAAGYIAAAVPVMTTGGRPSLLEATYLAAGAGAAVKLTVLLAMWGRP